MKCKCLPLFFEVAQSLLDGQGVERSRIELGGLLGFLGEIRVDGRGL